MITGASTAEAAIILVDARKGIQTQTRRHSYLVSLMGIRNVVIAINKMDLTGYSEKIFNEIVEDFNEFAESDQIEIENATAIPLSALNGDNITERGTNMTWYHGSTLLSLLETMKVDQEVALSKPFRLPVQWVNRPNLDFRGFAGTVASGSIKAGDPIRVQPSGKTSSIDRIAVSYTHLTLPTILLV